MNPMVENLGYEVMSCYYLSIETYFIEEIKYIHKINLFLIQYYELL
jgi:hypothetical protein